ncbi:unnamed protein product [Adineta ricciae]|nr:unnamed protein product [Adineta ricciae]
MVLTNALNCQCQCCRYFGRVHSTDSAQCACTPTNLGKPFACGGTSNIWSPRHCIKLVRPTYNPFTPNICCQFSTVS